MKSPEPDSINSASDLSLLTQVHKIAEEIAVLRHEFCNSGLLGGKPGMTLLFAYLHKLFPEKNYSSTLFDWLGDLSYSMANEELSHHLTGVAGTGFVFQHLRNMNVLDAADDLNLSELDEFISDGIDLDAKTNSWDPLHGMVGCGIYFLERNKETGEKKFLKKIVAHLENMRTQLDKYHIWITPGHEPYSDNNYNFGMAHGMPGILSFLAQVHERGISQQNIGQMISTCIPFLLNHERVSDPVYSFPSAVDVSLSADEMENSRLAWCYGDLCISNMLIHCGRCLKNKNWKQKGIDIALKTTRRSFHESGCMDAPFCHGSTGIAHQYLRLYHLTKNPVFRDTATRWIETTQNEFYKKDQGAGGYFFRSYDEKKNSFELNANYSLLEGSAGIALVFLSFLYDIQPDWDIIFQCNV
jgi:lantibiotic modifying enzyme